MMIRILQLVLLLIAMVPAGADTLHLKNGGKVEGRVIAETGGEIQFQMRHGKTVFKAADVARIERGPSLLERYRERAAGLAFTDLAGHYRLAQWCKSNGLAREMAAEARQVVALAPDHRGARSLLGQIKVGARWLPERQAMRELGYVWYGQRWRRPAELSEEQREQARRQRGAWIKQSVEELLRQMTTPDDKARAAARDRLLALAGEEGVPQLVEVAGRMYREYTGYWEARRKVVTELRLGLTQVQQPIRTIPLNLGGTSSLPVTIQLPQVTSISANTTTILPGGKR